MIGEKIKVEIIENREIELNDTREIAVVEPKAKNDAISGAKNLAV